MNCSYWDSSVSALPSTFVRDDVLFSVCIVLLTATSTGLLFWGERIVRPLSAVAAATASAATLFVVTPDTLDCNTRLIMSGVAAILAAVAALCVLKVGVAVLGGVGYGAFVHLLYTAIDPAGVAVSPWYYLVVIGTAIVGAGITVWKRKFILRLTTAIAGAGGIAWSIDLVTVRANSSNVHALVLLSIVVVLSLGGTYFQTRRAKRKHERKDIRRGQSSPDSSPRRHSSSRPFSSRSSSRAVMGIPVSTTDSSV
jgi:hypothetical protein